MTEEKKEMNIESTMSEKETDLPDPGIMTLEKELRETRDKWMRVAAELDNTRKRAAKDKQMAVRITTDSILLDFLETLDNFDRALATDSSDNHGEFAKGVQLIHQQLIDTLARRGVKEMEVSGEPFDPDLHEAMMQVDSDQAENRVVDVVQKGYVIYDRVLRHARVTVAKG
ncbi:MAG: nucleotide exchange factor GrpE [Candidatus Cloacimonetes bacterium 4572_55]|nr:MAG: nucleotide exchange factor GrpE [Candidatus Cloacimonetes bacterium 4572_55]